MQRQWQKTHEITMNGENISVMAIDNCGFTQEEYESEDFADFEFDKNGCWTFQGQTFTGQVTKVAELKTLEELYPELIVDKSLLFETVCLTKNMTVVVAPTGEAIDLRIIDGKLQITINTDTPDTPFSYTEEWDRNKYQKNPKEKIYYHRISLPAATRNQK